MLDPLLNPGLEVLFFFPSPEPQMSQLLQFQVVGHWQLASQTVICWSWDWKEAVGLEKQGIWPYWKSRWNEFSLLNWPGNTYFSSTIGIVFDDLVGLSSSRWMTHEYSGMGIWWQRGLFRTSLEKIVDSRMKEGSLSSEVEGIGLSLEVEAIGSKGLGSIISIEGGWWVVFCRFVFFEEEISSRPLGDYHHHQGLFLKLWFFASFASNEEYHLGLSIWE